MSVEQSQQRSTSSVLVAAVINGLAGYAVLVLIARMLTPAQNAEFLVFWGVLFACFGVLGGITTEGTRASYSALHTPGDRPIGTPHVMAVAFGVGLTAAAGIGVSGMWWAPHIFGAQPIVLLLALVLGVLAFSVQAGLVGVTSGRAWWPGVAMVLGGEGALRLAVTIVVALSISGINSFAVAAAIGPLCAVLLVTIHPRFRATVQIRADVDRKTFIVQVLNACAAAGASALLIVGFPVLLRLTTAPAVFATTAPLLLAVQLSRAPLLVPLGAYQGVVVTKVITGGVRSLAPIGKVGLALLAVGTPAAYWLGPPVLRLVNPLYQVSGAAFIGLFLAAIFVAALTISGACALAVNAHRYFSGGWIVATLITLGVLLLPADPTTRVVAALILGPAIGIGIHLVALRSSPT